MENIKFQILDDFIAEKQKIAKFSNELIRREKEALEKINSLKAEYQQILHDTVVNGNDMSEKLDQIDEEIKKAESNYVRRKEEREIFGKTQPLNTISAKDVVDSFNNDLIPQFKEKVFNNALKNLLKSKYEYAKAVEQYFGAINEFEKFRSSARAELSDHYYYQLNGISLKTRQEIEKYFITDGDLSEMERGKFPNSLQNVNAEEIE